MNNKTPLLIEPLTPELLTAALDLDRACFGGLWTIDGYQREIDSPNSSLLILKPPSCQNLLGIGCVWFVVDEAHITLLGIEASYRHQGLGMLLLLTLLERAIQQGSQWATLEVSANNTVAQSLYQNVGFTTVGRRKHYYKDTGEDALILWHKGLQAPSAQAQLSQTKAKTMQRIHQAGWEVNISGIPTL